MAINLYEFFDLTMETSSDYVSRYDIELNTFLREFEDNTEALFIDYQKVYLKKMSQAIIESINKINSNDPEGEFLFNHLQKKLATNRRILEFLDQRLNAPNKAIAPEPKENASKDEVSDFLDKLNNGKVIKSYMIDFLESRNTRQKLEALIEDIENYKVDYITNAFVYNETNTKPFLEESFTIFKELVLSKMEDLKSLEIVTNSKSSEKQEEKTKKVWFTVGKNIANGKIQEYNKEKLSNGRIAKKIGLKYSDGPYISKSKLLIPCRGERSRNNIFNYPDKIKEIYIYCVNNGIHMIPEFEKIAEKYL